MGRRARSCHLIGDAIRLSLKRIVDPPDSELRLYGSQTRRCRDRRWCPRSVGSVRRKYGDPAEIPRGARRCLSDHHVVRGDLLLLMISAGDRALEKEPVLYRIVATSMLHKRRALGASLLVEPSAAFVCGLATFGANIGGVLPDVT